MADDPLFQHVCSAPGCRKAVEFRITSDKFPGKDTFACARDLAYECRRFDASGPWTIESPFVGETIPTEPETAMGGGPALVTQREMDHARALERAGRMQATIQLAQKSGPEVARIKFVAGQIQLHPLVSWCVLELGIREKETRPKRSDGSLAG